MTGSDWLTVLAALFGVLPTVAGLVWFTIASARAHGEDET